MKVTVVGNGSIGRRHLKGITELQAELKVSEIRAFDTSPERRLQVKEEIPVAINYESLEESVRGTDIVFMCTPTSLHIPIYKDICTIGDFHIFFEKPLSHTIEGCEKMIFGQKAKGKQITVGYMLHYHPVLLRAKELIESGKLGRILSARAEAGFYLPQWHPWEEYNKFYMSCLFFCYFRF